MNFNLPYPNQNDSWITPKYIINAIGLSELDPFGYKHPDKGILVETARNYFFEQDDGLTKDWNYKSVFVNFPYSKARECMDKCTYEYQIHNNDIIVLCFNRSETKWYQNNVNFATGINMIKKRIKFIDFNGKLRSNGNAPSCLIAYGEDAYKRIKNIEGIYCRIDK